jgi:hypothetical protein
VAWCAALRGRHHQSARLAGAVSAVRRHGPAEESNPACDLYRQTVERVRVALGEDAFVATHAEGRALSLHAAVALTLEQARSA